MIVALVVAAAENGVIGRDGTLPWSLPADLKHFRTLTTGHHVVMGRKTHASIGRALPGRTNLVLTRHPERVASGCHAVTTLDDALALARAAGETVCFVIGGAGVYAQAMPRAGRIYRTEVQAAIDGDVSFPPLDPAHWVEVSREFRPADERNPYPLAFTVLERAADAAASRRTPA
ncbi:MAG: dihydrofolate reductase [Deltaproteobacteria bacterium]|nr:dihydrofolate reductase [Deltaproteobacteria bacterium]